MSNLGVSKFNKMRYAGRPRGNLGRCTMQARQSIAMALAVALAGCASTPQGSTVPVIPAANKPFDAYANDQAVCSQSA
jgi:hypothetical protein